MGISIELLRKGTEKMLQLPLEFVSPSLVFISTHLCTESCETCPFLFLNPPPPPQISFILALHLLGHLSGMHEVVNDTVRFESLLCFAHALAEWCKLQKP